MRKEVRLGAAIGGILIAVLIVFGIVSSRTKSRPNPGAVAVEKPSTDPGATDHADGQTAGETAGATGTGGHADADSHADATPSHSGSNWAALLRADHVEDLMPRTVADTSTGHAAMTDGAATPAPREPRATSNRERPTRAAIRAGSGANRVSSGAGAADDAVSPSDSAPIAASHVIKSGETFCSIARAVYGDVRYEKEIEKANPTVNPNNLKLGQMIKLPSPSQVKATEGRGSAARAARSASDSDSVSSPMPAVNSATEYRVKSSDSLYKISMKLYHTPNKMDAIYQLNKQAIGPDHDKLKLNMILKLPEPPTAGE